MVQLCPIERSYLVHFPDCKAVILSTDNHPFDQRLSAERAMISRDITPVAHDGFGPMVAKCFVRTRIPFKH